MPEINIVMVIDGHDWRYAGADWVWSDDPSLKGWDRLVRTPYTHKECMTCGTIAAPDADTAPCHEVWSAKTGYSAVARKENYHA